MYNLKVLRGACLIVLSLLLVPKNSLGEDQMDPMRISDGSKFVPQDSFPEFSWETTPTYYMFGNKKSLLSPEQLSFIAERTGFLCIEKSHGMGELKFAELGAKHEAAAFKKIKPEMKVLYYFNAAYAWPYTSYNKYFTKTRIDARPGLKKFLLTHPKTGKLADRYGAFCFDVLQPNFRDWWVKTVAKGVRESGCDGAFIDQMHGSVNLRKDKGAEIEIAMGEMMAALKEELGTDKILLANNAHTELAKYVYPVSDAIMFENYAASKSSKENLLVEWDEMLRNAKEGKISVFPSRRRRNRPEKSETEHAKACERECRVFPRLLPHRRTALFLFHVQLGLETDLRGARRFPRITQTARAPEGCLSAHLA